MGLVHVQARWHSSVRSIVRQLWKYCRSARMTFASQHSRVHPTGKPNSMKGCYHLTNGTTDYRFSRMRSRFIDLLEEEERLLWQAAQSLSTHRATTQGLTIRGSSSNLSQSSVLAPC